MSEHTPTPWKSTANSWQHTTIYDANGDVICRLDLEDWGVTEDNQDRLETVQAEVASQIVKVVNRDHHYEALLKALEFIRDGYDNQDVNHVDYRVRAYEVALEALATAGEGNADV